MRIKKNNTKSILLSLMFVGILNYGYSQNTLQIIKFEEAQELFNKNKFKETVSILIELENQGLINPKVLHLKILALSSYNHNEITQEVLNNLKVDVSKYLKDFDIKGLEDKYKEVYVVSKKLRSFESIILKRQADIYFDSKDFDKALPIYLSCIEIADNDINVILAISNTYNELSKIDANLRIESIKWKEKAAELGHIQSCVDVAIAYKEGLIIPSDILKAAKYFKNAAAENHPDGQFGMGWIYEFGVEGKFDYSESFKWYKKAADNSTFHPLSKYRMRPDYLGAIIEKSTPSTHTDYYVRERAMMSFIRHAKRYIYDIDFEKEIKESFKNGAEVHNSPMAQLFLYYIYTGYFQIKITKSGKLVEEIDPELAEKYLTLFKNNIRKNEIPYVQFLVACDLVDYPIEFLSAKTRNKLDLEFFNLCDQAISGGNFEATQHFIKNTKSAMFNEKYHAILKKNNIKY